MEEIDVPPARPEPDHEMQPPTDEERCAECGGQMATHYEMRGKRTVRTVCPKCYEDLIRRETRELVYKPTPDDELKKLLPSDELLGD